MSTPSATCADPLSIDPFLVETEGSDLLADLAADLPTVTPSGSLRSRVLNAALPSGRFERFAAVTAELLDLPVQAARALLDRLGDGSVWGPGLTPAMQLFHVQGGAQVDGAITGFVRIESGSGFPDHEHLGDEQVLIIQGSCVDGAGLVLKVGDRHHMSAGTSHGLTVRPGPDLVYLAVVFGGIRIGEEDMRADDPRL